MRGTTCYGYRCEDVSGIFGQRDDHYGYFVRCRNRGTGRNSQCAAGGQERFQGSTLGCRRFFILGGSVFCILAAALFYKERSRLAWYYGQMCLVESLADGTHIPEQLREYMRGADSWETWIPYSWGFTALVAGFVEYGSAALFVLAGPNSMLSSAAEIIGRFFPLLEVAFAFLQRHVWTHYIFSDEPWADFCRGENCVR